MTTVGQKFDYFDLLLKYVRSKLFCFQKSTAKRLTVVSKKDKTRADFTKPNVEIFFITMVIKVVKEDISKISARAQITEPTQWLSAKKNKSGVFILKSALI